MLRAIAASVAALLLAGCSDGDPATSRLSAGQEVLARRPDLVEDSKPARRPPPSEPGITPAFVPEFRTPKDWVAMKPEGDSTPHATVGSKVRVLSDDLIADVRDGSQLPHPDLDGVVDRRWVKVRVLEGLMKDHVGEMARNTLRPIGK